MADQEQVETLRRGATAWNAWRASQPEVTPDLSGADLRDTNLRGADLRDADLGGANLRGMDLRFSNLRGLRLPSVNLAQARLFRARLDGADLTDADLRDAWLSSVRLHGANLSGADLSGARLDRSAGRGAAFVDAVLRDANVSLASWRGADLRGLDARGTVFEHAVLTGADLGGARLGRARLAHADLSGADLSGADLRDAGMHHACLLAATVDDGDLAGAEGADTAIRRPDDPVPFERARPRVATTEPRPGHISTMFACQRPGCADTAGWVAVIAKGVSHPDDAALLRDVLERDGIAGQILVGGFLDMNTSSSLTPDGFERVSAGLTAGDILTVWEESEEYTPFYCQRCRAVFCARHCELQEHWDPDWGMTPDYWTGTCPNGHRIFIDH